MAASATLPRSRRASATAALCLLGIALLLPASAAADGPAGDRKLSERELRRLEARLLGPEHAADHARGRAAARRERARLRRLSPAQRRAERRRAASRALMATGDPATEGRWNGRSELPMSATHVAMLPTGKVLMFAQPGAQGNKLNEGRAYLWDPVARTTKAVTPPIDPETGKPANIWCAGQSLMADGQVLVTGGNLFYEGGGKGFAGLDKIYTFDPWSEKWTEQPDMAHGRWYPTQTLLPDGRTLIVAGWDETGNQTDNRDIEIFNPPATRGGRGTLTRYANAYGDVAGLPSTPELYPHMFLMPGGQVLGAGPSRFESFLLNAPFSGALTATDRADYERTRYYGSAVLEPQGTAGSTRVLQVGGYPQEGQPSTATSERIDAASNRVTPGPSLRTARAHNNVVLLPDRSMVSIGGGDGAPAPSRDKWLSTDPNHRRVELLAPGADRWELGPAQAYQRTYHSTAILLPDGRVLSAGDERDATASEVDVAELYEPAYLHKAGTRPAITGAPDATLWGRSFRVTTSTAIDDAVLVAPGAVTHANDMSQRLVPLQVTPTAGGADLVAPPSASVAPPGFYMLFVLTKGKPSVAHWVYLGAETAPAPTPTSGRPVPPGTPGPGPTPMPTPTPAPTATPTPAPGPQPPVLVQPPGVTPRGNPKGTPVTAPRARVRLATTASRVRRSARLPLRISLTRAGTVTLSARLTLARGARTVRFPQRGTTRVRFTRAGTRTLTLRLTRAHARRLRAGRATLRVSLRAVDAAGAARRQTITLRL